ncbi:hypothetical protein Tco_0945298, partial [Tanacetum coccineum]
MTSLPAADQRYPWLRYQVQEYIEEIRHSYEQRLEMIWSRPVNRVHVFDFEGLTPQDEAGSGCEIEDGVFWRGAIGVHESCLEETIWDPSTFGPRLGGVRRRMTWRQFILALGLHAEYEMADAGDFLGHAPSYVLIRDPVRRLCHMMIAYSISGRGQAPEKVTGVDLFYLCGMDRRTANVLHLLAQYLFRHADGRKSGARLSRGYFIGRLAMHFGLVSDKGLRGLQADEAGTPEADEAGQAAEEVAPKIPAPAHAPLPPPPAPQPRTMSQRIERLEEEVHDLWCDVVGLRGDVVNFTIEQSRVSTWLISYMTQLMDASG